MGVSRAREELSALTGIEAVEITATSAAAVGSPDSGDHLIVGTEAALHRVGRADVVAFLDFDQHLLAPRFAAGEEALGLLARAARVVGGREGGGRILVQTRQPDHEALSAAVHADPSRLTDGERELRAGLDLPPFAALATVGGPAAGELITGLRAIDGLSVSFLDDTKWLVKAPDVRTLCDGLASVPRPAGRVRVEVDPTDV
jgi:primosomal protein N' (replication factor Y)